MTLKISQYLITNQCILCAPLKHSSQVQGQDVLVARPDRGVTYPGAERVRGAISKRSQTAGPGLLVVLDGAHLATLDSTAVKVGLIKYNICTYTIKIVTCIMTYRNI